MKKTRHRGDSAMNGKWQMSTAAAKRVAADINARGYPLHYDDVIDALQAEKFNNVERRVDDLIVALRPLDDTSARRAVELIAMACASRVADQNDTLRAFKRGLRGIDVIFEDDVRSEALKP